MFAAQALCPRSDKLPILVLSYAIWTPIGLRSSLRKLRVIRIIMADRPFADALVETAVVVHTCAASNSPSLKLGVNNADSAQ